MPELGRNRLSLPSRAGGRVSLRWATAFVALLTWLVSPNVASAHGALRRSAPAAGASLDTIPRELRLEFNERVELRFTRVVLVGPDSEAVALGELTYGDSTRRLVSAIPSVDLTPGRYEVRWQTAGADGHPTRGRFAFSVRANATRPLPSAAPSTAEGSESGEGAQGASVAAMPSAASEQHSPDDAALFGERSVAYVVVRWIQYLAVFLLVGAFVFARVVLPRAAASGEEPNSLAVTARVRALRIGALASAALIAIQGARFVAQREALRGGGDFALDVSAADMLLGSVWGTGLLLLLLGSGISLLGFRKIRSSGRDTTLLVVLGIVATAVGLALSGHQAASRVGAPLGVVIDVTHVLATAGWLGTLALLVLTGIPGASAEDTIDHVHVARILRAFSPVVLVAAAVGGATGLVLAGVNLGSVVAVWQSDYGRVLLIKLGVLSLVAGSGAYNWRRVLPTLGTPSATAALRRSATVEAIVAVGVVGV
ncbi:MAG: copper resistance CopC/CopD family protein, partial [Gemmatimonadota bacterium]